MKKSLIATLPVAAFVAGMAIVPSVFAEDDLNVTTWEGLTTCLTSEGTATCKLGGTINEATTRVDIVGDKTLDLNGYNITSTNASLLFVIKDYPSSLNITGRGIITSGHPTTGMGLLGGDENAAPGSGKLIIGPEVTLHNTPIIFNPKNGTNYGSQLDFYGTITNDRPKSNEIYVNGKIANTGANAPIINIMNGAVLDGGKGTGVAPFYLAGYSNTTIYDATVRGDSGIIIKSGYLTLDGTKVTAEGAYSEGAAETNGETTTGAAIQISSIEPYIGDIVIDIKGDSVLTSEQGNVIQQYGTKNDALQEIAVAPGVEFIAKGEQNAVSVVDTTFSGYDALEPLTEVKDYTFPAPEVPVTPEEPEESVDNPNTADSIALYATVAVLALLGLGATAFLTKKSSR